MQLSKGKHLQKSGLGLNAIFIHLNICHTGMLASKKTFIHDMCSTL